MTVTARSQGPTVLFAALPMRAIPDSRLTASHFRVLAAIASHDRISGPRERGAGCWASNRTLADKCSINYTNLSTAITELVQWGYITRGKHPINRKLNVYRVVYDDLPEGKGSPDDLSSGKPCAPDASSAEPGIVCPQIGRAEQSQGDSGVEYIPRKREDITQKREHRFREAAPTQVGGARNDGAFLAIIERELRGGQLLDEVTRRRVEEIVDSTDREDALHNQAERILASWGEE